MSEPIQIEASLTPQHICKYASLARNQGKLTFIFGVFFIVTILIGLKLASADYFSQAVINSYFAGLFTLLIIGLISCTFLYKWNQSSKVFGPFTYTIDSSKIVSIAGYAHIEHPWSAVERLVRHNGIILIFYDPHLAHVIPESEVEDPNALYKQLQIWFDASRPSPNA